MSINPDGLKVKKDAAVSALFSLYKAAGDASSAVLDLINYLESTGLDVSDLRSAFTGGIPAGNAKPDSVQKLVAATESANAPKNEAISSQPSKEPAAEESTQTQEGAEADAGKKKPKRAPKDPNAPKRPLNAFLKFRNQESKKISEERKSKGEPDLPRNDMSAAVKEHWENLPESVRENLVRESKSELERYHANLASYKESNASNHEEAVSSQLESSQPELSQATSQEVLTQDEGRSESSSQSPQKKKQKKRDEGKKDDKEKKKRKKSHSSE